MKKWLFLLFVAVAIGACMSCGSLKYSSESEPFGDDASSAVDTAYYYEGESVGSAPPDEEVIGAPGSITGSAPPGDVSTEVSPPPPPTDVVETISPTPSVISPQIQIGEISYNLPDTMTYGKVEIITLRIAKQEEDSVLIAETSSGNPFVIVKGIRVSSIMTAELIDPSPDKSMFIIKPLSSIEQNIEDYGYTQWEWSVKPVKAGKHPLKLVIKVKLFGENGSSIKDIPVYDNNIYVHAKPAAAVASFWDKYWQWIISTFLIPIFIYFWKNRKKEKPEE